MKSSSDSSSRALIRVQTSKSNNISAKVNISLNKSSPVVFAEPLPARLKGQPGNLILSRPPVSKQTKVLDLTGNISKSMIKERLGSPTLDEKKYNLEKITNISTHMRDEKKTKSTREKQIDREKLELLNQLYHSNLLMREKSGKSRKGSQEKLMLPHLNKDSSTANASQNNSQLNYTTTTKRQSKSCTSSNLDSILMGQQQQSPAKPKNIKSESVSKKSNKENIHITQLPEFMSNLINKTNNSDKQKQHSNIINIVNNLDPNNDQKIAFKVNVNQYDIKYYAPSKSGGSSDSYLTDQKTLSDVEIIDNTKENHVSNKNKFIELSKAAKAEKKKPKPMSKLERIKSILPLEENSEKKIRHSEVNTPKFNKNKEGMSNNKFEEIKEEENVKLFENIEKAGHTKSNSMLNPNELRLMKPRKSGYKMHSMGITSNNTLPKYTLAKTMTYSTTKISDNLFRPPSATKEAEVKENKLTSGGNRIEVEKLTYDRGGTHYGDDDMNENTHINNENIDFMENQENHSNMNEVTFLRMNSNTNQLQSLNTTLNNNLSLIHKLSDTPFWTTTNNINKHLEFGSDQKVKIRHKSISQLKSLPSVGSLKHQSSFQSQSQSDNEIPFYLKKKSQESIMTKSAITQSLDDFSEMRAEKAEITQNVETKNIIFNKLEEKEEDDLIYIIYSRNREKDLTSQGSRMGLKFNNETLRTLNKIKKTQKNFEQLTRKLSFGEQSKYSYKIDKYPFLLKLNNPKPRQSSIKNQDSASLFLRTISMYYSGRKSGGEGGLINSNPMEYRLYQIENKRNSDKGTLTSSSLKYISKNFRQKVKEKNLIGNRLKVLSFYKHAFGSTISNLLETHEAGYLDMMVEPIKFNDHQKILLFQYLNDFLQTKYMDLFKEFLIDIFHRQTNFYQKDVNGNEIGKYILETFRLDNEFSRAEKLKPPAKKISSLLKASDTNLVRVFGFVNHRFVNSSIINDVMGVYQEEENRGKEGSDGDKTGESEKESVVVRGKNRRVTPNFLKRKSDLQAIYNIREMRRSAFSVIVKNQGSNFSLNRRSLKKNKATSNSECSSDQSIAKKRSDSVTIKQDFTTYILNLNASNMIKFNNFNLPNLPRTTYKRFAFRRNIVSFPPMQMEKFKDFSLLANEDFVRSRFIEKNEM
jgi:hypothetical protein